MFVTEKLCSVYLFTLVEKWDSFIQWTSLEKIKSTFDTAVSRDLGNNNRKE